MTTLNVAFAPQIAAAAGRHGIDPRLLAAVAAQETGGPSASSGRNIVGDGGHGHGVFQIDDRWHAFARSAGAMDPARNADYAAGMLSGLLQRYGGNVRAALSAYNAGSPNARGTTTDWGDRTLGYADSVLRHYTALGGGTGAGSARDAQIADLPATAASVGALRSFAGASAASGTAPTMSSIPPAPIPKAKSHEDRAKAEAPRDLGIATSDDDDPSGPRAIA